jgi:co-chaperonin GroES (HSP10)
MPCNPLRLVLMLLLGLFMAGCDNEEAVQKLTEALQIGEKNLTGLTISSTQNKLIFEPGEVWQLVATGITQNDSTVDVTSDVRWISDNAQLATVNSAGLMTVQAVSGSQTLVIRAEWGPFSESLELLVSDAELLSLSVSNDPLTPDECLSSQLLATGTYSDSTQRPMSDASWIVDNSELATVSGNTLITRKSGLVTVTATRGEVSSPTATITVLDTLTALNLDPADLFSMRVDTTRQINALGDFTNGSVAQNINPATIWRALPQTVAMVSAEGVITAAGTGDAIITGTCGDLTQTVTVSVLDVEGIRIKDPLTTKLRPGEVRALGLVEVLSDGTETTEDLADNDSVIWEIIVGTEVATIDEDGVLTIKDSFGNFAGSFIRITADYQQFEDEIEIFLDK